MSAHNAATLDYAMRRTNWVISHLREGNAACQEWADRVEQIVNAGRTGGSLRQWITAHEGDTLDTLQATLNLSGADVVAFRDLWASGPRVVDQVRSTFFASNGSRRDYAGMITYVSEPTIGWVGFTEWAGHLQLVAYYVELD